MTKSSAVSPFSKTVYQGDLIKKAANRVGRSESTGGRWADRWNEGGLEGLAPSFEGGRPPKLDDQEQEQLIERLRDGQPWKSQEIQHLLNQEFDVEYHPNYLADFLHELGLSYSIPRTKRPSRPDNAEEIIDERVVDALDEDETGDAEPHDKQEGDGEGGWELDDDICTDGGTVVGFFDASHPQPWEQLSSCLVRR